MIEGHSPHRNELWHSWYIFCTIWYILKNIWYILELLKPLSYYPWSVYSFKDLWEVIRDRFLLQNGLWNTYLHFHSPFLHLETLRKLLKVVPHLITDFGNIGTSFTKFDTSLAKFGTSFTKFGTLWRIYQILWRMYQGFQSAFWGGDRPPIHFLMGSKMKSCIIHVQMGNPKTIRSDVPNFERDVPSVPKCISKRGLAPNHFIMGF